MVTKRCPEDWQEYTIGKLGNLINKTISPMDTPDDFFTEYSMPAFDAGQKPNKVKGYEMQSNRTAITGKVLLFNKLNVRKKRVWLVNAISTNSVCSQEFLPYTSDEIELGFLKQLLLSDSVTNDFIGMSTGTSNSQKRIQPKSFLNYSVVLPSLSEQKAIASALSDIDELIVNLEKIIEKKKNIKTTCLQHMFPQTGQAVPEMRLPGFTAPWERCKLGDLGTIQTCKRIFKEQTSDVGDVPFYKNGTIGLKADAYISRELFEEFKRLYPYPEVGDILISAVGSVGRTAEYTGADEYFQDSNVVWLKTDGSIEKKYLKVFYQVIEWLIEGTTVKHLYNDNILRSTIVMPKDRTEQRAIGLFFEQLDHLITLHQCKLDKLRMIKQGMMQKLLNGEIRLV